MKASVDREACIGCGLCVEICPAVFELDDEDIAVVKTDPVPAEAEAACRQAADACPQAAIEITE